MGPDAHEKVAIEPDAYAGDGGDGIFVVLCETSHRVADDPIVFYGQPGGSHDHTFIGNRSTDAFSTTASLLAAPDSSCDVVEDDSAYWIPTVYQNGQPVDLDGTEIYYFGFLRTGRLVAPPDGLRMIAGDATGQRDTAVGGSVRLGFTCANQHEDYQRTPPTNCTEDNPIVMRIDFPDCWNGVDLDTPDHQSHVAYSSFTLSPFGLSCPDSHPVPIPTVRLNVKLGISDGSGLSLASGGLETIHADVFTAWQGDRLEELVGQINDGGLHPLPGVEDTIEQAVADTVTALGG